MLRGDQDKAILVYRQIVRQYKGILSFIFLLRLPLSKRFLQNILQRMKVFKSTLFVSCICSVLFVSCLSTDLGSLASGLMGGGGSSTRSSPFTNSEAIAAMKDALTEGIKSSSSQLSATDGYFGNAALKILLPDEADVMIDNIGKIPGGQKLVDDVILRLNRSAEEAAKEVVPIFTNVITGMSVSDGIAIVTGGENAATEYLREKTYSQLMDLYRPKVASALGKPLVAGISANSAWTTLTTNYNKVGAPLNKAATFIGKEEPMPEVAVDLATFATEKALDGLFSQIAEKEAEIRDNPLAYTSSMIKKVFGAVKQGLYF